MSDPLYSLSSLGLWFFILSLNFIVKIFIFSIFTMITITINSTGLSPDKAFTISFQASSFPAITAPNVLGFKYFFLWDLLISMSFLFYMLYCSVSLAFMFLSIIAILTFTLPSTLPSIMKTRTIHL